MSCSVCGPGCQTAAGLPSFCGDGVVDGKNAEACDDGNVTDGDGRDSTCTPTGCGNGVAIGAELCAARKASEPSHLRPRLFQRRDELRDRPPLLGGDPHAVLAGETRVEEG